MSEVIQARKIAAQLAAIWETKTPIAQWKSAHVARYLIILGEVK